MENNSWLKYGPMYCNGKFSNFIYFNEYSFCDFYKKKEDKIILLFVWGGLEEKISINNEIICFKFAAV